MTDNHYKLHKKFVSGLKNDYAMTDEQIKEVQEKWWFCGGRAHYKIESSGNIEDFIYPEYLWWESYFKQYFPNEPLPDQIDECVCHTKILYNCYITDGNEVLIIGRCCKNHFIVNSGKTCSRCRKSHRNKKDNYCDDCRILIQQEKIKLSETCQCGKKRDSKYKYCFQCNQKMKLEYSNILAKFSLLK